MSDTFEHIGKPASRIRDRIARHRLSAIPENVIVGPWKPRLIEAPKKPDIEIMKAAVEMHAQCIVREYGIWNAFDAVKEIADQFERQIKWTEANIIKHFLEDGEK